MSAILYGGEWALTYMGWNVLAVIGGKCEFSLMGLCVPALYGLVRK